MEPTLKKLFEGVEVTHSSGRMDRTVSCLTTDSRRAGPQCLFFALPGEQTDGSFFIEEAIDRGAAAVVTEESRRPHSGVAFIQVPDARLAMARVARRFFGSPDETLALYGVLGSHGKTTAVHLMKHLLDAAGGRAGMIGSIAYDLGSRVVPSVRTTPDAVELSGMLGEMRKAPVREAVIEIDESGIRQKSVFGLNFRVAVFLNLSAEGDAAGEADGSRYALARELFTGCSGAVPEKAVIHRDDPRGQKLIDELPGDASVVTFGRSPESDVRAVRTEPGRFSTRIELAWPEGTAEIDLPLVGEHNADNFLAAAAVCYAVGRDPGSFGGALAGLKPIPGRMERIEGDQAFDVFVDHGHTASALDAALRSLKQVTAGRLLVVFGCGGNRARPPRAGVVTTIQQNADFFWATVDNPRGESLEQIFDDMRGGVVAPDAIEFVDDRREAIRRAFDAAKEGDCVLLAGKGHESFQELGDTLVPFDDRMVARKLLALRKT